MIKISIESHFELTNAGMAEELKLRGYGAEGENGAIKAFGPETVRRWFIALGMRKLRMYLMPSLTKKQQFNRLDWTLNEAEVNENQNCFEFGENYDCVHIDEAWYYKRVNGRVVKLLKNVDGTWTVPEVVRSRSKKFIDKMMFIAAVCRPHPIYPSEQGGNQAHTGKCYFGNFTTRTQYIRGLRAGQERILNVSVDSSAYSSKMKDDIIPGIMRSMWWHHKDSGKPEAGKTIYIQQDGASPHTSSFTRRRQQYLMSNNFYSRYGFRFDIVTQPAQSPDLNLCDLTIWHSNKSTLRGKRWASRIEMEADILASWNAYPREKIEAGWRTLYSVYRGILSSGGDNNFSKHSGDRKRRREGLGPDISLPRDLYVQAVARRDQLAAELGLEFEEGEGAQDPCGGDSDDGGDIYFSE